MVQAANDKQQIEPMVEKLKTLPEELGKPKTLLADNGYFSASNVTGCETADIAPLIATGRDAHHPSLAECAATAPGKPQDPTAVQAMAHRLQTQEGKQLYALRKQVPGPVFGIIKSLLGFRQFLLRGLDRVRGPIEVGTPLQPHSSVGELGPTGCQGALLGHRKRGK